MYLKVCVKQELIIVTMPINIYGVGAIESRVF